MKEKIILAAGASGSELLRTLAKAGKSTMGLRMMSPVELSAHALMKSGIALTEDFLTKKEEPSVIYSFLNEIPYFRSASYKDAENMSAALGVMRNLIPENELEAVRFGLAAGEFEDKNEALLRVYGRYTGILRSGGRIDSIGIVRKAIENCLTEKTAKAADYYYLKEFPLTPLQERLLQKVSGESAQEISLKELAGRAAATRAGHMNYIEGYGRINEVENIIAGIYRKGLPLDSCLIACTNASAYSQIILDLAKQHHIPVTFGCGIPISNSNPARLLKTLHIWNTSGYNGIDALESLLLCEGFDRSALKTKLGLEEDLTRKSIEELAEMAGSLRISFNKETNRKRLENFKSSSAAEGQEELIRQMEILAAELEEGIAHMVENYSIIRADAEGRIDQSAVNVISESLRAYERYAPDGDIKELIPELLSKTVCSENSREGCLHVTTIPGAMSAMRKNLFVCGLSAAEFPGSPRENYLLLDKDLEVFAGERAPVSANRIAEKKESLFSLLDFAGAMESEITLSYSGYNLAELKEQNPSSVLFEIYEKANPEATMEEFRSRLKTAGYFESGLSICEPAGRAYSSGTGLHFSPCEKNPEISGNPLERAWSPSALETFFQCPRRFYLTRILGIPEKEEDDPFEVMDAGTTGTLAHKLMEDLGAEELSREEFLAKAGQAFDDALKARPPIQEISGQQSRKEFLRMMATAFDMDPHNEVLSAEEEYSFEHPAGVKLHGYPDRVEKAEDGSLLIADFKTKRKIEHEEDDIDSCLQVVVYAWLCQQAGIDVSRCEYRYMRKGKTVSCVYDGDMKQRLSEKLETFRDCLSSGDYPRNPGSNDENCRYCKMAEICLWPQDMTDEFMEKEGE